MSVYAACGIRHVKTSGFFEHPYKGFEKDLKECKMLRDWLQIPV